MDKNYGKNIKNIKLLNRILLYIFIIIGAFIILMPFIWMVLSSLKDTEQIFRWPPTILPNPIVFTGYHEANDIWDLTRYYLNSIFVGICVTGGSIFICTIAGYAFAHMKFPGRNFWFIYVLISLLLPVQVWMIPSFLVLKWLGWLNTYQGLIIPWWATGFGIFYMRQMATVIPKSYLEAAKIDGCSEFRILWSIVFPLLRPGMVALGILTFISNWNEFLWPLIVINDEAKKTLPMLVASLAGGLVESPVPWPVRMAVSTLVVIPVIIVYIFAQRSIMSAVLIQSGIK